MAERERTCSGGTLRDEDKSREELVRELRELRGGLCAGAAYSFPEGRAAVNDALLTHLVENIPGISIHGYRPSGEVVYWNRASEALYGYSADEAIGGNILDLVASEESRPFFELCLETGKGLTRSGEFAPGCELVLRNRQGGAVPVYSVHTAVCIDGMEPLLFCIVIDFSDRKQMEEELLNAKKLEAIGVLAGGIAHDFNNLLFVILGNISMAQLKLGGGPALRHLSEAEKACMRAKDLTQKFITFSSGGGPVKNYVSMRELVSGMVSLILSGSHALSVLDIPEDLWGVDVDENQMRQVLTGILSNSKEAMPHGGVITIRAENVEFPDDPGSGNGNGNRRFVKVEISDEGVGIQEEHLPRIFDPYFSTKYRGSQKGMGFGLAIAHSVIKRHNGQIKVESTPGEGTTVSILIPASPPRGIPLPAAAPVIPISRKRVLVMDDEEMLNELIQTMLEHLGFDVDIVYDGEAAFEKYSEVLAKGGDYAAIILDLTVKGGMGGREAVEKLLGLNPEVKAIVSSGYSNDPIMSDFADYGFRDVLRKPYDLAQLRVVLDRVLG